MQNRNMRLGQLARKLALRPSEVVDFLSSKSIAIEDGANARLADDHVNLIVRKFTSFSSIEAFDASKVEKVEVQPQPVAPPQEEASGVENGAINDAIPSPEPDAKEELDEKLEVIKAPKLELQGLKVLGKIELPESKKKVSISNEEIAADSATPIISQPAAAAKPLTEPRRQASSRSPRPEQRPHKNPIAAARELEQIEARKRREREAEQLKEQKTKNYYKKVKAVSPTRRARIIDEQTEEMALNETKEAPKTWFGKIAKWFRT